MDAAAASAAGEEAPPFKLLAYRSALKRMEHLSISSRTDPLFMRTDAALLRGLCELYPDRGFGRNLLIDGCLFPASCAQKGKGADED